MEWKMEVLTSLIAGAALLLVNLIAVESVTMRITPATVTVGGETTATPYPTTSPSEVELECNSDGTFGVERIYSLYLSRKRQQDSDYVNCVEISSDNLPELSNPPPADITQKNWQLTGSISSGQSGRLTVRIPYDRLDCSDEASYRCRMYYKPSTGESASEEDTRSLTISFLPTLLQLSATQTTVFPQPLQNMSFASPGTLIEYTCTGSIGEESSTLIGWQRRFPGTNTVAYVPPNAGDVTQETPTPVICPYSRTSRLRYTLTSLDRFGVAFRCQVTASGQMGIFNSYSDELHVTAVLPTLLQLSATQTTVFPQPLQNMSFASPGTLIEYTCTGSIGEESSTLIGWQRRFPGTNTVAYVPPNAGDVTQETPTPVICPYSRTSRLRYTLTSLDRFGVAFRCQVTASGQMGIFNSYSDELHVTAGSTFYPTSHGARMFDSGLLRMIPLCLVIRLFLLTS